MAAAWLWWDWGPALPMNPISSHQHQLADVFLSHLGSISPLLSYLVIDFFAAQGQLLVAFGGARTGSKTASDNRNLEMSDHEIWSCRSVTLRW